MTAQTKSPRPGLCAGVWLYGVPDQVRDGAAGASIFLPVTPVPARHPGENRGPLLKESALFRRQGQNDLAATEFVHVVMGAHGYFPYPLGQGYCIWVMALTR